MDRRQLWGFPSMPVVCFWIPNLGVGVNPSEQALQVEGLLPGRLGGLFPQLSIQGRSLESVADRKVLFQKWPGEYRKKREGETHLLGEGWEMGCPFEGERERHLRFSEASWDFKSSLTPPCLGWNLLGRGSPWVVSQPVREWLGHLKVWPGF